MSVKRYQPAAQCVEPSYQAQMVEPKVMEFSEGEYVLHSDYARLKAEVDNSNLINTELLVLSNQQASEVRRLQAEVERLRKAVDDFLEKNCSNPNGCGCGEWNCVSLDDFLALHLARKNKAKEEAAKEGKQS